MLHKHLFLYFPHAGVLLFLVRPSHIRLISWNLMLSNHSYHVPLILEHYRNLRGKHLNLWVKHLTFQESIVAKNKQRRRRVYFFRGSLYYHFLNGMLHKHLFLYFPHAGLLLFLVRPSLHIRLISWNLMLSNHSYHVPLILEHYKTWEVKTFPFKNQ